MSSFLYISNIFISSRSLPSQRCLRKISYVDYTWQKSSLQIDTVPYSLICMHTCILVEAHIWYCAYLWPLTLQSMQHQKHWNGKRLDICLKNLLTWSQGAFVKLSRNQQTRLTQSLCWGGCVQIQQSFWSTQTVLLVNFSFSMKIKKFIQNFYCGTQQQLLLGTIRYWVNGE